MVKHRAFRYIVGGTLGATAIMLFTGGVRLPRTKTHSTRWPPWPEA